MYEELIKDLRYCANPDAPCSACKYLDIGCDMAIAEKAADAIEELSKRVPVPPHGRLIDADALIDKVITKYVEHERKGELVFAAAEIKQDICDLISDAPTIIPAEEGE